MHRVLILALASLAGPQSPTPRPIPLVTTNECASGESHCRTPKWCQNYESQYQANCSCNGDGAGCRTKCRKSACHCSHTQT